MDYKFFSSISDGNSELFLDTSNGNFWLEVSGVLTKEGNSSKESDPKILGLIQELESDEDELNEEDEWDN